MWLCVVSFPGTSDAEYASTRSGCVIGISVGEGRVEFLPPINFVFYHPVSKMVFIAMPAPPMRVGVVNLHPLSRETWETGRCPPATPLRLLEASDVVGEQCSSALVPGSERPFTSAGQPGLLATHSVT